MAIPLPPLALYSLGQVVSPLRLGTSPSGRQNRLGQIMSNVLAVPASASLLLKQVHKCERGCYFD